MRLAAHPRTYVLAVVVGSSAVLAIVGCYDRGFHLPNDFHAELWPVYVALFKAHVAAAAAAAPFYAGSALLRAPFALLTIAAGGGWLVTYFVTAVPCFIAPPLLALWLGQRLQLEPKEHQRMLILFAALTVLNPVVMFAGVLGHPEELVGACLVIASVVAATTDSPVLAGILVGIAVPNKPGLAGAVFVTVAVAPRGKLKVVAGTALGFAALYGPVELLKLIGHGSATVGLGTGSLLYATDLVFWLGDKSWFVLEAHKLIMVISALVASLWWWARGRRLVDAEVRTREAMFLLAFVMFLRTALEPWAQVYYCLPFLYAMYTLDRTDHRAASLLITGLTTVAVTPFDYGTAELRAAIYALVAVPVFLVLAARVFGGAEVWQRWTAVRQTDPAPAVRLVAEHH